MAQIRNFGFEPPVQESDFQHAPRPCCGIRKQRGKPEGTEHALCHPHHTGAHGQGLGGDFPFRHYHQQFADGAVPAVQIFAPERAGTAGHKVFRCVGGDICQEDDGF